MKRIRQNTIHYLTVFLLGLSVHLLSCSDEPTGPGNGRTYTINVHVSDEYGEPLKGIEVITSPVTVTHVTNQYGYATMNNIPRGNYQIIVIHKDIPVFYRNVNLGTETVIDLEFIVAAKIDLNVVVKNDNGEFLPGVDIETIPATQKITTDGDGIARFIGIPFQEYTYILSRSGYNVVVQPRKIYLKDGLASDITFSIESQPPMMDIITPRSGNLDDIFEVRFVGDGFDFEDGKLPETKINWYSDIHGHLGYGSEIVCDRLSVGHHLITLRGIDSEGNVTEAKVGIDLYYYDKDSYFPIPKGGEWFYNYAITNFELMNADGEVEQWTLQDLQTTMDAIDARTSFMQYEIRNGNTVRTAQYALIDQFTTDVDSIYVLTTEEHLTLYYQRSHMLNPYREMDIVTEYHNLAETGDSDFGYPLIKDHLDPANVESYNTMVSADVTWYYDDEIFGSQEFFETLTIDTSIDIGIPETVQTDLGVYENAVPITITQGESVRYWWLAKGIGLVKIQYDSFGFMQTAVLYETNIEEYRAQGLFGAGKAASTHGAGPQLRKKLTSRPGSADEMKEIRNFLRGLVPR